MREEKVQKCRVTSPRIDVLVLVCFLKSQKRCLVDDAREVQARINQRGRISETSGEILQRVYRELMLSRVTDLRG